MNSLPFLSLSESWIRRPNMEELKTGVLVNAWLLQARWPWGNLSHTSGLKLWGPKGSLGLSFYYFCMDAKGKLPALTESFQDIGLTQFHWALHIMWRRKEYSFGSPEQCYGCCLRRLWALRRCCINFSTLSFWSHFAPSFNDFYYMWPCSPVGWASDWLCDGRRFDPERGPVLLW